MHIRYYVFKPCKGHLKVDCLYGTGLARVNRTAQKWINFLWHIVTTRAIMVVLTDFTNKWWEILINQPYWSIIKDGLCRPIKGLYKCVMIVGPKVTGLTYKAAPNGKCCEGYIKPSMVSLMYQYQYCWNKGRLYWKIAKLFYFCHLKNLVRPETFGPTLVHELLHVFVEIWCWFH